MTPSLPTFSIASAMILPIVGVAVGRDGADLRDLLGLSLVGLAIFFSSSTTGLDGLVDAALDLHRVVAGGDQLRPSR
jgi:hypothetical protein